jgi:hypothetical protein
MNLPTPPSPGSCAELPARLRVLERSAGDAASAAMAQELRRHLTGCTPCREAHAARLATLEGLCALRSREVPGGLLEDLKSRVLSQMRAPSTSQPGSARTDAARLDAGGMSAAFLDAPASLARWRGMALAASVLLAVGGGLLASGRLALVPESGAQDRELRDALLARLDARYGRTDGDPRLDGSGRRDDDALQPVMLPGHGMRGYYVVRPTPVRAPPRTAGTTASQPEAPRAGPAAVQPGRGAPERSAPETGD